MQKKAIIIGAGPAGLTAAYELLKRTDIKPIILEKSGDIGGISKTINYKGNRMDIGGHRFFSKSDRVMKWWMNIMPIQDTGDIYTTITYQRNHRTIVQEETHLHTSTDDKNVMLVRKRLSRIYFLRKFFNYPIQLSLDTLKKLGLIRTIQILLSYTYSQLFRRKPEKSLEDFLINRFGKKLYLLFFKDYTEKVWGVPCHQISAEWGAQRIKGVSIMKAIRHAAETMLKKRKDLNDIAQKDTETSLIEQFLYPALGPGQLWEEVSRQIEVLGGIIVMHQDVKEIKLTGNIVTGVETVDTQSGKHTTYTGNYFFSTMPVQELIAGMNGDVPQEVKEIAAGLQYRDFITVGVLLQKLSTTDNKTRETKSLNLKDTWIYIQEKDVKVGRLQLFNNWSPYMVNKPGTIWVGMEYFCNKDDAFWNLTDENIQKKAIEELQQMGLAQIQDVLDSTVHRVEKTYPAYFGTYNRFDKIRAYVDHFENLFLVGRNGMHKYNNSDHSMLTAMVAVDNICDGVTSKENIWTINTEQEYHEEKKSDRLKNEPHLQDEQAQAEFPFTYFIFQKHRLTLLVAVILFLIQFITFKIFYPYPNFMPDSYSYLDAAVLNSEINIWPVGYSKFLRIFSALIHTDTALIFVQYIFITSATLYLVFTVLYMLNARKAVCWILLSFSILNPVHLFISNYISADALFTSLSLVWLGLLLWLLHRPNPKYIWMNALILLLLFTIRYNAIYYPLITILCFLLARLKLSLKMTGIALNVFVISIFIWHNSNKYFELSGNRQFSAFGGWQMASNALFMYSHVKDDKNIPPTRFSLLHQLVRSHMDSLSHLRERPDKKLGVYYLWNGSAPLKRYMTKKWMGDSTADYFKKWASMAPLYAAYGTYLIQTHPSAFIKYYLWPNFINYTIPPIEFLGEYNMGKDSIKELAKDWFAYKSLRITHLTKDHQVKILRKYPAFIAIVNGGFLFGFIGFAFFRGFKNASNLFQKKLVLISCLWITNMGFSILAAPVVLRYQIFVATVCFIFSVLLADFILNVDKNESNL